MVKNMDLSDVFSMLLNNKINNSQKTYNQQTNQNNTQNIYPFCPNFNQQNKASNNDLFNNNNNNNLLSYLLPLVMGKQTINPQDLLSKIGTTNPLVSTLINSLENKTSQKKEQSKIDVTDLVKVETE